MIPIDKIKKFLIENKDFIDGICLSGGEPTIYNELPIFLSKIKSMGLKIKIDTNGSKPEMVKKIIKEKLVDFFAMDIKAPLNEKYDVLTGSHVEIDDIKKSISIIMNSGIDYEFRTTVVPGLLTPIDIINIAKYIENANTFVLQQFQPTHTLDKKLNEIEPYNSKTINEIADSVKNYVKKVKKRGVKD